MTDSYSFGEWVKHRRKALRLTQREIATAAFCSTAMVKKIEADERRPSPELARSLATALKISLERQSLFVEVARGQRPVDHLAPAATVPDISPAPLPSASYTTTLPTPATPFIGRAKELEAVAEQLQRDQVRLVTLLGPGGIGKTRLAIEAARKMQADFADGVIFVPLASVNDPEQVPQAILQSLHLSLVGSDPPAVQLQRILRHRHMLLVLDNFEHIVAGAGLLSELLATAPRLQLLVTSRERLNLAEEWLFPVPELDEAAALFAQSAVRVKPDFDAATEDTAVTAICHLVGGHPLAVELAASWTRFISCAQIADQIRQDLNFLGHAPRNAPDATAAYAPYSTIPGSCSLLPNKNPWPSSLSFAAVSPPSRRKPSPVPTGRFSSGWWINRWSKRGATTALICTK